MKNANLQKKYVIEATKDYQKFSIGREQWPKYESPQQFGNQFKKCSILRYDDVRYSNTSSSIIIKWLFWESCG